MQVEYLHTVCANYVQKLLALRRRSKREGEQIAELQGRMQQLEAELMIKSRSLADKIKKIEEAVNKIEEKKTKIAELEKKMKTKKTALADAEKEGKKHERDSKRKDQRIKELLVFKDQFEVMARRLMELEKLMRKEANPNNEKGVQVGAETNYKSMQSELTAAEIE